MRRLSQSVPDNKVSGTEGEDNDYPLYNIPVNSRYVLLYFLSRFELMDNTDIINIVAVTVFGVQHRFSDGFTYGQSFWMTVCSTAASTITNATLIWDLYRTPDFNKSGMNILFIMAQE